MRGFFYGAARLPGRGLARPVNLAVLCGPARHEKWLVVPCLGQRLSPWAGEAQPGRHDVPCLPDLLRAVPGPCPCRTSLLAIYNRSSCHIYRAWKVSKIYFNC